ncbi:MAG: CHAP domain-containing protein [Clostridia bacterium]|nr:CHAP domain-containing protein [Clostridia bacterium]
MILALISTVCILRFGERQTYALDFGYQASAVYSDSHYYKRAKAVQTTGRQSIDILCIAASQLGYHEGNALTDLDGHNMRGTENYTEFAYWFGTRVMGNDSGFYSAWCAFFVSWCARQAGISESVLSNAAYARPDRASASGGYGYFHLDPIYPGDHMPRSGELVFIDWEADNTWDHVGLVLYCDGQRIGTVEGNASDAVRYRVYLLDDPQIRAYGAPKYNDAEGEDLGSPVFESYMDAWAAVYRAAEGSIRLFGGITEG